MQQNQDTNSAADVRPIFTRYEGYEAVIRIDLDQLDRMITHIRDYEEKQSSAEQKTQAKQLLQSAKEKGKKADAKSTAAKNPLAASPAISRIDPAIMNHAADMDFHINALCLDHELATNTLRKTVQRLTAEGSAISVDTSEQLVEEYALLTSHLNLLENIRDYIIQNAYKRTSSDQSGHNPLTQTPSSTFVDEPKVPFDYATKFNHYAESLTSLKNDLEPYQKQANIDIQFSKLEEKIDALKQNVSSLEIINHNMPENPSAISSEIKSLKERISRFEEIKINNIIADAMATQSSDRIAFEIHTLTRELSRLNKASSSKPESIHAHQEIIILTERIMKLEKARDILEDNKIQIIIASNNKNDIQVEYNNQSLRLQSLQRKKDPSDTKITDHEQAVSARILQLKQALGLEQARQSQPVASSNPRARPRMHKASHAEVPLTITPPLIRPKNTM